MNYKHYSIEEREKIQELLWQKQSMRSIARVLGRSESSVSREIGRNRPPERNRYTPRAAHEQALENRKSRGRKERLKNDRIRTYVVRHLKERWSPEQIAGRIRRDLGERISHEAIYQYMYTQVHREGAGYVRPGREDLRVYLRRKRKRRTPKGARRCQRVLKIQGTSIDVRPLAVDRKERIGDWEGDTVKSKGHKPGVNTLLERKTGLFFVTKLQARTSASTTTAVADRLGALPLKFRRTLTLDNGSENSRWEEVESTLGVRCFFAHPYHSWERGANENANGLLREYFPKKTDFGTIPDDEIRKVEYALTERCISSLIFMLMPRLEHEPKQQRFQRLERNPPQASTGDETTGLETVPDCRRPGRHSCGCQPVGQLSLRQC
jgi:transposase, IS30 family